MLTLIIYWSTRKKLGLWILIAAMGFSAILGNSVAYADVQKVDPRLLPELANDSRVKTGVNDAACVDTAYPQKFVRGIRTPYGAYCLEDREGVEAFPTDQDIPSAQDPKRGKKLSLDQLLQILQIGYLVQQLAAINDLVAKTAALGASFEKDVKAWQKEKMEDVVSRIEKLPENFASNAEIVNALGSAAKAQLLSDRQFINALKEAMKN